MNSKSKIRFSQGILVTLLGMTMALPIAAQTKQQMLPLNPQPAPATEMAKAGTDADIQAVSSTAGKPHDPSYVIGADDVLAINVWKEADISRTVPVRSDGKISLPLAGEIQAAGVSPKQLEDEIAQKLGSYIEDPAVTVIVQEIKSRRFNILGQVAKPGTYSLTNSVTVLDAIAMAGGFRDFAKKKSIYVLRTKADGTQERLHFNYKQVIKGEQESQNVKLQPHDTVVIP